jgi:transcriptional regulator with XRE-family HTH domain
MTSKPLRSGGHIWGPQRVALGISIRQLAELSGVHRGTLSLIEQGRLVPTGEDYQKVMKALADYQKPEAIA